MLLIDKPSGLTSHDVVIRTRRALHIKKIGHIGTLDPLATGILPLVIGRATRLATFLSIAPKTYDAAIRLGASTDTFDRTGVFQPSTSKVIMGLESRTSPSVDRHSVENVLNKFTGSFSQTPPPSQWICRRDFPQRDESRLRSPLPPLGPLPLRGH